MKIIKSLSVYILALTVSGCATDGTFVKNSRVASVIPPEVMALDRGMPLSDRHPGLLLKIEYVGGITQKALDVWRQEARNGQLEFLSSDSRGAPFIPLVTNERVDSRIQDTINKSGYYALRLFNHIVRSGRFPADTVALQSVTLDVDPAHPDELVVRRDMSAVPSVLTLRFNAKRDMFDVSTGLLAVTNNTFANYIAPEFVLFTEPGAWPVSGGVIAGAGWAGDVSAGSALFTCDPVTCPSQAMDFGPLIHVNAHQFVQWYGKVGYKTSQIPKTRSLQFGNNLTMQHMMLQLPVTDVLSPNAEGEMVGRGQVPFSAFGDEVEALALQALNQVNPYLAMRMQWKRYISAFDPDLAARWPNAELTPGELLRITYIKKIMRAERHLVATQSKLFADNRVNGAIGIKLREQLQAEFGLMQRIQGIAAQQQQQQILQFGSYLAANYGPGAPRGITQAVQNLAFIQQSLQTAQDQGAVIQSVQSQYAYSYGDLPEELGNLSETVKVDGEDIASGTVKAFRATLAQKYQQRFSGPLQTKQLVCSDHDDNGWQVKWSTYICGMTTPTFDTAPGYAQLYGAAGVYAFNVDSQGKAGHLLNFARFNTSMANLGSADSAILRRTPFDLWTNDMRIGFTSTFIGPDNLKIYWIPDGTRVAVADPASKKDRPATPVEVSAAQKAWNDWLTTATATIGNAD